MNPVTTVAFAFALDYARRGWSVFPCHPLSKIPATEHGFKDATTDLAVIDKWWSRCPTYNVAIATGSRSHLTVLDFDTKNGQPGKATFHQLQREIGELATLTSITPSGGFHLLFESPSQVIGNRAGIFPGLDVRGDGGYILVPGSQLPDGPYRWHNGVPPATMPGKLVSLLGRPNGNRANGGLNGSTQPLDILSILDGIPEGSRDDMLYRYSCSLAGRGVKEAEARALVTLAATRCKPLYNLASAMDKVTRAYRDFVIPDADLEAWAKVIPVTLTTQPGAQVKAPPERASKYVYLQSLDRFHEIDTHLFYSRPQLDAMFPNPDPKNRMRWSEAFFRNHGTVGDTIFTDTTYAPSQPWTVNGRLNLWTPGTLGRVAGHPSPWLWLLNRLVPDAGEQQHLLRWMAFTVQQPSIKINHALLVVGPTPGQGKDTFFKPLELILGQHNCGMIFADTLNSQYNAFLKNRKLIVVQEIMDFLDKGRISNYLKPLLASPPEEIEIREKYVGHFTQPNIAHFVFFSNEAVPMRITKGDRRYFPIQIEAPPLGTDSNRIWDWYTKEQGYEMIHEYLMNYDLSDFDPKEPPPQTRYKEELIEESYGELDGQIVHMMQDFPERFQCFTVSSVRLLLDGSWSNDRIGRSLRRLGFNKGSISVKGKAIRYWCTRELVGDRDAITRHLTS